MALAGLRCRHHTTWRHALVQQKCSFKTRHAYFQPSVKNPEHADGRHAYSTGEFQQVDTGRAGCPLGLVLLVSFTRNMYNSHVRQSQTVQPVWHKGRGSPQESLCQMLYT